MAEKRTRRRGFLASREGLKLLEAKRREKGYTYESLAKAAGLNGDDQVKRLFNPHWGCKVQKDAIEKIAAVLELNPKDFIEDWLPTKNLQQPQSKIDLHSLNWWEISSLMWEHQQKQQRIRRKATEMGFEVKVYVPLGLVERKQQQRRSGIVDREHIHQLDQEVVTRIYEHQEFLDDIIGAKTTDQDQHIAIIGEPGAGKTTLLDRIATYIKDKTQNLLICIPLANLQGRTLKTYIFKEWLPQAIALSYPELESEALEKNFQQRLNQGGVWLLLDGADEGKLSLQDIQTELTNFVNIRVVLTCRTNVWDNYVNNPLMGFKTYKTQDFKPEQIDEFIQDWFVQAKDELAGKKLQEKLKEPQRDRIRQLVTNPLRLALLCQIFYKDKNAQLPETKAGLYEQFVRYFYEWKPAIVGVDWGTQPQLQNELHQALGKLAIAGLDSNYRYRLPLSLITTEMDDKLFKLAWDLGWLTLVDREENTDEAVYAFYHPTFQEYFAALAIDDWDFFLPRDHVDRPVTGKRYRIFEDQWRDPILFWIANKHIKKDDKENFIEALATFEDNCENLYAYRCVFLAAILTSEFKDCSIADLIIKQIVFWRLGYYYEEEEIIFINITDRILQNILLETDREKTINHLINFLELTDDPVIHLRGLWSLGKIDYGNQSVIIKLINILTSSQNQSKYDAAYILGEIASKNELAIAILSEIIEKDFDDEYMRGQAAWSLGKISPGNNLAIKTLIDIMSTTKDQYLVTIATKSLIGIGSNNKEAIIGLTKIIKTIQNQDNKAFFAWALGKIDHGNKLAISSLLQLLANSNSETQCLKFSTFITAITQGNPFAFNQLLKILKTIDSVFIIDKITYNLFKLTYKNKDKINDLIKLLKTNEDQQTVIKIISILGSMAMGSQLAISTIIEIILSSHNYSIRAMAVDSLTNILENRQQYIDVVKAFRPYVKNKAYKNNYEILRNYLEILWNCAQHMSYPEFYQARHEPNEETIKQLETQHNDLGKFLNKLQPTDQIYPILINGKYSLENLTDESAIAQELCNQIYEAIFPDEKIPSVKNAPELKRLFPKFKTQLNTPSLALVIYNIEPYPKLINLCCQLLGKFHTAFITEQNIEPPLSGFPIQANLTEVLQNWLTEISYEKL